LREKPGSFVTWFLPLLVLAENNVELIDLLELFGLDKLAEAVERLGGSRITFPTWATIDALVRDAYLLARLDNLIGKANNLTNRERLEEEFEAPLELLLFRARAVKGAIRKAGRAGEVPGSEAADRWLSEVQKTNGEIARAVAEANEIAEMPPSPKPPKKGYYPNVPPF
jgi:hypothetical protein